MNLNIPIPTKQPQKITVEEVRLELRKIEEVMFGELVTDKTMIKLNTWLDVRINKPYDLKIKAELVNNNVKLFGYDLDSKAVLDPNCKIKFISKTRFKGK